MSVSKDINGKESSKRLWAKRFLSLGFVIAILFFLIWIIAFFKEVDMPEFPLDIWLGIMSFGSGLGISTVFETKKD